ncbi:hypothetical protein EGW08_019049, partial [Elysia chlorotica]
MSMNRCDSPLQAKAKRRQSDAKWRASVATCYDTLKYVVPNVKNMAKRKISKALILQESEKHIKELESAVSHLLEVEGKTQGKTVLWEEESHWSHCTLEKLRQDFSEKQQRVFQMAAHGRRCYNLLQDIKEEVFAMEADPSRLAVMEESFGAASSLSSKICTLTLPNLTKEKSDTDVKGVPPIHRINLVLSGPSTVASNQQSLATSAKKSLYFETTTASLRGKKLLTQVPSSASDSVSTQVPQLERSATISHIYNKPIMSSFSSLHKPMMEPISSVATKSFPGPSNSCGRNNNNITVSADGRSKTFSSHRLSIRPASPTASQSQSYSSHQGLSKENPQGKLCVPIADTPSQENIQRLKIHIEHVNGDLYIVSDNRTSMIHLVKAASSTVAGTSSGFPLQKTFVAEEEQEQQVPSMKLPVKLPADSEKEDNYNGLQQFTLSDLREPSSCIKNELQSSLSACGGSDGSHEESAQKNSYTVNVSSGTSVSLTPSRSGESLPQALDIKEECVDPDMYTPRNNRDPLLSSLATPKPDDSTPLFMRTDNDLVIKRPPRLGTARKKLNFGQSPDKLDSWSSGKNLRQAGGFTPVKLPNEFGMVPDEDGKSMGSLISPWKIVDSPSYSCGVSSQNCMVATGMLDLDDSLVCLETMDTMDLDDQYDGSHMLSASGNEDKGAQSERTTKRKVLSISPGTSLRQQPKCRKKLDDFYEDANSSWEECAKKSFASNMEEENHLVPDICSIIKKEMPHELSDMDHQFDCSHLSESAAKQMSESKEEESHVVPEFNANSSSTSTTNDHGVSRQEFHAGPTSPENSAFYSSNDCDDFDGFYYYYRFMSQQLKQDSKKSCNTKKALEIGTFSQQAENIITPLRPLNLESSPSIAARVAHMWACLPLHDKLTMATLASLEERHSQKSEAHQPHTDGSLGDCFNICLDNQKCEGQDNTTQSDTGSGSDDRPQSQDCNVKLEPSPQLDLLTIGDHGQNVHEISLMTKEDESMESDPQCPLNEFHSSVHPYSVQHSGLNQDCVTDLKSLKDIEDIHSSLTSPGYSQSVIKSEFVDQKEDQSQVVPDSQDIFVLGELSPDLQEVEIQPLVDHAYD